MKAAAKKEWLFLKSLNLLKSNPNKAGLVVLFDALFIVSAFVLNRLFQYFAQSLALPPSIASAVIFLVFTLIFYLIILLAYSFFKYCVLDFIKFIFDGMEFSFKRLGKFYSLNIIIAGIFFAVMVVLNFVLAGIRQQYQPFVFVALAVPYSLFLYIIANTAQSMFYRGASVKESVNNSLKIAFTKIKVYREIVLVMIFAALILGLLFLGSGYLVRLISAKNYTLYLNAYAYFKNASIIIFDLAFYFVILINRVSFYYIAVQEKNY